MKTDQYELIDTCGSCGRPYTATVTVSPGSPDRAEYRCPICHAVLRHREYDRRDIALVPAAGF